jgi:O-antigen ligase
MFQNRVTWALLAFAVVGAPLLFGSTEPFMIAFWCVILGIALIVCNVHKLRLVHFMLLTLSVAVTLALGFVLHEQIALRPWVAAPHPLWAEAAKVLDEAVPASVSIAKNQPWFSMGGPLLAVLTLTVSFVVNIDRILAWRLFRVIAWAGAAYALYAIAAFLLEPTKVLWREKLGHLNSLTGTFTNRNTAADFFGTCSIVWLLIGLEEVQKLLPHHDSSFAESFRRILDSATRGLAVSIMMFLLCLAALFLTASRAGVVLSFAAFLITIVSIYRHVIPARGRALSVIFIAGAVLLLLLQIMGSGIGNRFDLEGAVDNGRMAAYHSTLNMISDRPWFGTGLGTFEMAFPAYRSGEISMVGIWNRAHNTLLEIASDLGIPMAIIIVGGWLFVIAQLTRGVIRRRRDESLPVAGLAVGFLGLTHSLVDFSLQIPGYAILFYSMIGIGLAQSFSTGEREVP